MLQGRPHRLQHLVVLVIWTKARPKFPSSLARTHALRHRGRRQAQTKTRRLRIGRARARHDSPIDGEEKEGWKRKGFLGKARTSRCLLRRTQLNCFVWRECSPEPYLERPPSRLSPILSLLDLLAPLLPAFSLHLSKGQEHRFLRLLFFLLVVVLCSPYVPFCGSVRGSVFALPHFSEPTATPPFALCVSSLAGVY